MVREREERGRDRDRRAKASEPRRDLEDEVRRQGEELRDLKAKLERSSKLTVFTARDAGEAKSALQVAVFLTGLFREHMQGILQTYQDARDQARDGGGVASASTGRVEPLKVLMYNGLIQHMVAYAEKICPEALTRCQEIAGFLAGSDITAISNTQRPPTTDAPWVLVITFAGSARGRSMRALWDTDEIQRLVSKKNGMWPELGVKPGTWRPTALYRDVAEDCGVPVKSQGKGKGQGKGPLQTGVKRRSESPDAREGIGFQRRRS